MMDEKNDATKRYLAYLSLQFLSEKNDDKVIELFLDLYWTCDMEPFFEEQRRKMQEQDAIIDQIRDKIDEILFNLSREI